MPSDSGSFQTTGGVQAIAAPADGSGKISQVTFAVSRWHLLGRLIKNKIFGLFTFGFYRFWGKTHVRRILWEGASIENDRLEYMGTAKELFLGFLIAMIILLPLMLVASLIAGLLSAVTPGLPGGSDMVNIAVLYAFWQFARYRLWRYRLSRTSWRGIRFFLSGSALTYAWQVLLRMALAVVTLGWAYPWLRAYKLDYQLNNTHFGDGKFTYEGTAGGLFRIYWPFILIGQLVIGAIIIYFISTDAVSLSTTTVLAVDKEKLTAGEHAALMLTAGGLLIFMTLSVLSFAVRVWEFRYLAGVTTFGLARFSSRLRIRSVLAIFLLLLVLMIIGYVGFAVMIVLIIKSGPAAGLAQLIFIPAFIVAWISFDILKTLFLLVPLVKAVCHSLYVHNVDVFEETAAMSVNSPKYGEGFADAMDVGAF
ncbi:MAG: DUF898 domain-containing protein [Sneathiella sp.]|nr:DUF898 domain-containing protein [Sneathiella sp.]